ncbi:hypothetical protein HDU87_007111 [Geranomyces variabilis]|uniref:Karyogamy protein 5 n=1 Tax=Geranomyces variabilis TaxID=109894 RepID=A0AAD5XKL1_9FUNG|nr:hypothetical protein HDU87_007111 [Geranomyces variabilis]
MEAGDYDLEQILDSSFRGHMTREQRLALENANGMVQAYETAGNGCFKAAVTKLKAGCSTLSLGEEQKITYAVFLTRCEIATASIPIPSECEPHAVDVDVYACIEILSHVPQLWTSYSGYVREVGEDPRYYSALRGQLAVNKLTWPALLVNMCFAVQYENHRDTVEHLFNNVTAHQISSYRLLRRQYKDMESWHDHQMRRLTNVEQLQTSLISQADEIKTSAKSASAIAHGLDTNLTAALSTLQEILLKHLEVQMVADKLAETTTALGGKMNDGLESSAARAESMDSTLKHVALEIIKLVDYERATVAFMQNLQNTLSSFAEQLSTQSDSALEAISRMDGNVIAAEAKLEHFVAQNTAKLTNLMGTVDDLFREQGTQLQRTLDTLAVLKTTADQNLGMQTDLRTELQEFKHAHDTLAQSWMRSFARAEDQLNNLSDRSAHQIQLLIEAASTATSRHTELVQALKPLKMLMRKLYGMLWDFHRG